MNQTLLRKLYGALAILVFFSLGSADLFAQRPVACVDNPSAYWEAKILGLEVEFTDQSCGIPNSQVTQIKYEFGDGTEMTTNTAGGVVTHLYPQAATYRVVQTVTFANRPQPGVWIQNVVVPEFEGNSFHEFVGVKKNSMANSFDPLENDHLSKADYDINVTTAPVHGTLTPPPYANDLLTYTPAPGFSGWDVIAYVAASGSTETDTSFIYINIYEEDCGFDAKLTSHWKNCPDGCPVNGARDPIGQPTPNGPACWGYTLTLDNFADPLAEVDLLIEIDPNMAIKFTQNADGDDVVDGKLEGVNTVGGEILAIEALSEHTLHIRLLPGKVFPAQGEYHYSFLVDVLSDGSSSGGSTDKFYHTFMHGSVRCQNQTEFTDVVQELIDQEGEACDPNDIKAYPSGCGPTNSIGRNVTEIVYTIDFENEGTGPANRVIIEDFLSSGYDVTSIDLLDAEPFIPKKNIVPQANAVQFVFDDINLVPRSVDSVASQGFVKFSVKIDTSITDGTVLENHAEIFFDLNLPISTDTISYTMRDVSPFPIFDLGPDIDTTSTTACFGVAFNVTEGSGNYSYGWYLEGDTSYSFTSTSLTVCPFDSFWVMGVVIDNLTGCSSADRVNYNINDLVNNEANLSQVWSINAFPNPFNESTLIRVEGDQKSDINIEVFDRMGKKVQQLYQGPVFGGQPLEVRFDSKDLPVGVYYYRVSHENGVVQSGSILKTN